jgi:hypothetical protein
MNFKLGKLPPKPHLFSLPFDKYLGTALPPPSPTAAWQDAVPDSQWGMYGNDQIGDCTCAAKAHILMAVTANAGQGIVMPSLDEVIAMYSAVSGYDPRTGANDNGAAMTDVNAYLLQHGLAGRKILGWVKIDHTSRVHFEQCVELFGACDVGVHLPEFAEEQFDHDQPWELSPNNGPIAGGHDVPYFGYHKQDESCVTWGRVQLCSLDWFQQFADEGYGLIWEDWFDTHTGLSPSHFDRDQLWEDLQALKAA